MLIFASVHIHRALLLLIFITLFHTAARLPESQKKIKILVLFSEVGSGKSVADFNLLGMEMALNENIKYKDQIELVKASTGSSAKQIAETAISAIETHKPDLIYGGSTSNAAFVIGDIAESKKIPYISSSATHPDVTKDKNYVFRTCFDDAHQAAKIAEFIFKTKRYQKGIILFDSNETYAVGMKRIFEKSFEELGGKIIKTLPYSSPKDIDENFIKKIENQSFDFIFLPGYQVESGAIISNLIDQIPNPPVFVGGDGWGGGRLLPNILQGSLEKFEGYYVEHWSKYSKTPANLIFLDKLKQKEYSETWYPSIALGYDSMAVILKALETGGSIVSALEQVDHSGVSGRILFSESRHTPNKELFIYHLDKSGEKFLRTFK